MKKITEKYEKNLQEDLLNPLEAAEYLNAALEDGTQEIIFDGFERCRSFKRYF